MSAEEGEGILSDHVIFDRLGDVVGEALGCPLPYRLHSGDNGSVFELSDGSVIKLTRRIEEAALAQVARDGDVPEWSEITPAIHGVYELRDENGHPVYVIRREDAFDVLRDDDEVEEWIDAWEDVRWTVEGRDQAPVLSDDDGPFSEIQGRAARALKVGFHLRDLTLENLGYGARGLVIRDFGECSLPTSLSHRRNVTFDGLPDHVPVPSNCG